MIKTDLAQVRVDPAPLRVKQQSLDLIQEALEEVCEMLGEAVDSYNDGEAKELAMEADKLMFAAALLSVAYEDLDEIFDEN